ncbi:MAG: hypothetical protein ACFFB5_10720 [Promethearchaeota archaeon]
MTKEDIKKLLQKKKGDRDETRIVVKMSLVGFFTMILGTIYWVISYFSRSPDNFLWSSLVIFTGSCLSGLSIFLIYIGEYLYYQFHEPFLPRHWLYQGVLRTYFQIFYFGSFSITFLLCLRFYNHFDIVFALFFLFLSLPTDVGIIFGRMNRIRNLFEDFISNGRTDSTEVPSEA